MKANRNPILTNVVVVKPTQNIEKSDNSKCTSCRNSGKEFITVSRDGNTFIKMYYCRTCSHHWRDIEVINHAS
jgi:hypothetical protein